MMKPKDKGLTWPPDEAETKLSKEAEDAELTRLCMVFSEKSLAEAWDNEDDAHWASFLNDDEPWEEDNFACRRCCFNPFSILRPFGRKGAAGCSCVECFG